MLTADDTPTIRNAILKRLNHEPGVNDTGLRVFTIKFQKYARGDGYWADPPNCKIHAIAGEPFIRVVLGLFIGETLIQDSRFDLPDPFEHGHLLAEIDEIANAANAARKDFFTAAQTVSERKPVPGSGTRGNWSRYGTLMAKHG